MRGGSPLRIKYTSEREYNSPRRPLNSVRVHRSLKYEYEENNLLIKENL